MLSRWKSQMSSGPTTAKTSSAGGCPVAITWTASATPPTAALVLAPVAAAVLLVVVVAVLAVTRYTSLASLVAAAVGGVTLALQVIVTGQPPALLLFAIVGPALIWLFHIDNIGRLLRGEERKFGAK